MDNWIFSMTMYLLYLQFNNFSSHILFYRELFLSQPILLELEAPLKICGKLLIIIQKGRCSCLGCYLLIIYRIEDKKICHLAIIEKNFPCLGDIHGQYYDLLRLFEYGGFPPEVTRLFCSRSFLQAPVCPVLYIWQIIFIYPKFSLQQK